MGVEDVEITLQTLLTGRVVPVLPDVDGHIGRSGQHCGPTSQEVNQEQKKWFHKQKVL